MVACDGFELRAAFTAGHARAIARHELTNRVTRVFMNVSPVALARFDSLTGWTGFWRPVLREGQIPGFRFPDASGRTSRISLRFLRQSESGGHPPWLRFQTISSA